MKNYSLKFVVGGLSLYLVLVSCSRIGDIIIERRGESTFEVRGNLYAFIEEASPCRYITTSEQRPTYYYSISPVDYDEGKEYAGECKYMDDSDMKRDKDTVLKNPLHLTHKNQVNKPTLLPTYPVAKDTTKGFPKKTTYKNIDNAIDVNAQKGILKEMKEVGIIMKEIEKKLEDYRKSEQEKAEQEK